MYDLDCWPFNLCSLHGYRLPRTKSVPALQCYTHTHTHTVTMQRQTTTIVMTLSVSCWLTLHNKSRLSCWRWLMTHWEPSALTSRAWICRRCIFISCGCCWQIWHTWKICNAATNQQHCHNHQLTITFSSSNISQADGNLTQRLITINVQHTNWYLD